MIIFLVTLITVGVFLLPHVIFVIAKMLSVAFHLNVTYRPYLYTALVMVALWLVLFCWGHWFGRYFHETKEVDIECKGLPAAFKDYKVVHISDLHLDGWAGHDDELLEIVKGINELNADVIVFTGDLVSLSKDELKPLIPVLKQLKAKEGIISIMGNHDYMPYNHKATEKERAANVAELQRMEREDLGWKLLLNEHVILHKGDDSIAVIGCENQSLGVHSVIKRGNLKKAMKGTEGMYKVILTHDPTHWRGEILGVQPHEEIAGSLTLSGHTHSGQFRVFGMSVAAFIYKEYDGLYTEGDEHLYVNIGLGGTMPMRVGATPEITLIHLQ